MSQEERKNLATLFIAVAVVLIVVAVLTAPWSLPVKLAVIAAGLLAAAVATMKTGGR